MTADEERMRILEMIDSGKITAAEGLRLLESLSEEDQASTQEASETLPISIVIDPSEVRADSEQSEEIPGASTASQDSIPEVSPAPQPSAPPLEATKWRRFWMIPLWIGVFITILGSVFMYMAYLNAGFQFGFFCSGIFFTLGMLVLIFAWQTRTAPWLHLRVQQSPGSKPERIAFSFPIPIRPTVWFLRVFGNRIEGMRDKNIDEMLLAVGSNTSPDNPIYIQVDEGEDGEKVEIYIG